MNYIRKIDTFLLENYPIAWHSKIIYLLLGGIILNIIFFFIGFFSVTLDFLKYESISSFYWNSLLIYLHIILVIIGLCFWALAFYKKNAVRHLYPLSKGYFTILFVHLFIGFSLFITPYYSSIFGMTTKANVLVDVEELKNDIPTINKAALFLPNSENDYTLSNRVYPDPFPVKKIEFDYAKQRWGENDLRESDDDFYRPKDHPENNDTIDANIYQFYTSYYKTIQKGCESSSKWYIKKFIDVDTSLGLHRIHLLNYSDLFFDEGYFNRKRYNFLYYDYERNDDKGSIEFRKYAPVLHNWIYTNKTDSMIQLVEQFKFILNKYTISHYIDSKILINYLSQKHFYGFNANLVSDQYDPSRFNGMIQDAELNANNLDNLLSIKYAKAPFGVNISQLRKVYNNVNYAQFSVFDSGSLFVIFVLVVLLSMLFLLFEFAPFIPLLLSIPIFGALMILNGIFSYLFIFSFGNSGGDSSILFLIQYFLFVVFILWMAWYSIRSKMKKNVSAIVMILGYWVVPFLPMLIVNILDYYTKYKVYSTCDPYGTTVYSFWHDVLDLPSLITFFGVLFLFFYLLIVKKFYSKPE